MGGERQRLRSMDTPGPGSYTGELVQERPKGSSNPPFHSGEGINWVKVATAPSIPSRGLTSGYEEGHNGALLQQSSGAAGLTSAPGPGAYNPSLDMVKGHGRILQSFGRVHSAPRASEITPGPGAYDAPDKRNGSERLQSVFASTTGRAKLSPDSYGPGPGGYKMQSGFQSLKQFLAANPDSYSAFGSSSKDPRAVRYDNQVPGPGSYVRPGDGPSTKDGITSQFASGSKRFMAPDSATPGPGVYNDYRAQFAHSIDKKTKGKFGVFGSTSSRFAQQHVDMLPPVGTYDIDKPPSSPVGARKDTRSSAFKAPIRPKVDRFDDRPIAYDTTGQWPKPHTTSTAFVSSVPRFGVQHNSATPGPGTYTSDLNVPRGQIERTPGFGKGSRFTDVDSRNIPGPGAYNPSTGVFNRKSFNITIGGSW
eukprot:GILJ01022696.1.p1 GENE.GILJ01022696.1~~GILJ01022696.1.p1  ORF type:complete len:476 (-),score=38.50 GILJ01022696.1:44-1306(-)